MNRGQDIEDALAEMFLRARAQFGSAVRSTWNYPPDSCPGCRKTGDSFAFRGKNSLSFNAFIYRKRGVLIGYFLCNRCAKQVFRDAERNPGVETARHANIELNLIDAYHRHMKSLDS